MKLSIATAVVLAAAPLIASCQNLGLTTFKRSQISVIGAPPGPAEYDPEAGGSYTIGSVLIWSNDVNAAVIYNSGQICAQRAMTALTASTDISGSLSDALVKMERENASAEALASVQSTIAEIATRLSTTTERTAFLDIGLYYLCQLGANGTLNEQQANELVNLLIVAAAGMTPIEGDEPSSRGTASGEAGDTTPQTPPAALSN